MSSVNLNTQVVGVAPDMSLDEFAKVLIEGSALSAEDINQGYQAVIKWKVSPAFALAIFRKESKFGLDPNSIVFKFKTNNPGNCRSSTIGPLPLISTDKGVFVKYPDWATGFEDLAHRLVAPDYVYNQEKLVTIEQIINRWAPPSENNTELYIANIVKFMGEWIGEGDNSMAPKPNIKWVGSPNHYNGRSGQGVIAIVDHIMQGTMDSTRGWFNNPASQVSSTFGVGKDGSIEQYVDLANAAWANGIAENIDASVPWLVSAVKGNINENNLTVSIEHEGSTGDVMPEAQYQATLALHRWLIALYSIPVDRHHILGHYQISGHIKANCPGTGFPWARLMGDLANGGLDKVTSQNQNPIPKPDPNKVNGHTLGGGFKSFYDKLAAVSPNFQLLTLGYPVTDEFDCDVDNNGKNFTVQLFERCFLIYESAAPTPWDVRVGTTAQLANVLLAARAKAFI